MNINKESLLNEIQHFDESANSSQLPSWQELPGIELYMDQVIVLLNQYLAKDITTPITQSMINNYVKLKAIPAPVKKRYSKIHLAYLIIFCTLKQTLSIATIQKIMPVDMNENDVISLYESFIDNRQKSLEYTAERTRSITKDILNCNTDEQKQIKDIIMQICNCAGMFKQIGEKILCVEDIDNEINNK